MNRASIRVPLLVTIAILAIVSCFRYEKVWSGAEFDSSGGMSLRLAADEPFCGCIDLSNKSDQAVLVRSRIGSLERGHALIPAGENAVYKFDWAGPEFTDVFVIEAFTAEQPRQKLPAKSVLRINSYTWPFHQCDATRCEWGPLLMNTGSLNIK